MQITNTLTRKKEAFTPLVSGKVSMYVCGPTVYNFIHIGNARVFVFYDVVHRFLETLGYSVVRVMNFTDVDDKIINKAREEKRSSFEVGERYIKEFIDDMALLNVRPPTRAPKVTDHMGQIIHLIEGLVAEKAAYVVSDGEVFFSVRDFKGYGKLSGKNVDDLQVGTRVQPGELKKDPLDFSLWKPQKAADEPAWDSPWGKGRPGWHIECSAMSMNYLGESFDIHGGGIDLIHPHHENEIAQSEGFTHKPFVRYWLHTNMLTFNAEKMSKSLGNIMLVRDFVKRYSAEVLKYFLLSGHYRSTIDYSEQHVREVQAALHRFYTTLGKCEVMALAKAATTSKPSAEEEELLKVGKTFEGRWRESMEDDLNTARLLGYVFEYVRALNAYFDKKKFQPTSQTPVIAQMFLDDIRKLSGVLNIFGEKSGEFLGQLRSLVLIEKGLRQEDIEKAITDRTAARQRKDFATSDKIRAELLAKGIELRDRASDTDWDIVFT